MQRIFLLLLYFNLALFIACSTEVDLTADWKETTIIYGLLNQHDDTHYVKVYKTFLDPDLKPADMARVFDSLYYKQVDVKMEEIINGQVTSTRILLADNSIPKDPGVFAYPQQVLYKDTLPINQEAIYRILVNIPGSNGENKTSVTAETPIVKDFKVSTPLGGTKLSLVSATPYSIKWVSAENGKVYKLEALVHYSEKNLITTKKVVKEPLKWLIFNRMKSRKANGGESMVFDLNRQNFYNFINAEFETNDEVLRSLDSLTFVFYVGSETLSKYIDVQLAQTGIVQTQIKPEFTNVEGGIGLFASRYTKEIRGMKLNTASLDSLGCGSITGHLNFKPSKSHQNYPFCK